MVCLLSCTTTKNFQVYIGTWHILCKNKAHSFHFLKQSFITSIRPSPTKCTHADMVQQDRWGTFGCLLVCVERLKVNVPVGSLNEDNLEHCAVALYKELPRGHTVVGEANASQHSFQLVTCGGQICYNWTTADGMLARLLSHFAFGTSSVGSKW